MIQNINRINKLKREQVKRGLNYIDNINASNKFPIIKKVVLFGSCVTNNCSEKSDIDICLFTDFNCSNPDYFKIYGGLPIVVNYLCDIVVYSNLQNSLKKEVDTKGVVVYEFGNKRDIKNE